MTDQVKAARYVRKTEMSDTQMKSRIIDRLTGKCIIEVDETDPANYLYSMEDRFEILGLNLDGQVDVVDCVYVE